MSSTPFDIGIVHFIGIGGIGMSGIAEIMHRLGYQLQGSDAADSANIARLRALNIPIFIGQKAENLGDAQVVVISSAIKADNAELKEAKKRHIPIVGRAEMLGELMRQKWSIAVAGTHGKTTTTSMVAAVLEAGRLDPTVVNGGIINHYGTNVRQGQGDWMVVEADESDGSFIRLPATLAIVTNLDPEHLDYYGDFETEKKAFHNFLNRIPFYGAAILCIDHPEVQSLIPLIENRQVITYGRSPQADVRAEAMRFEAGYAIFSVRIRAHRTFKEGLFAGHEGEQDLLLKEMRLPMPGEHNVQNALAALAAGLFLGVAEADLRHAFQTFSGVKRRFTKTGEVAGVSVIDDYGHHPVEIAAVLKAARQSYKGQVFAVVQPHRYSRLNSLFEEFCTCFNDADRVIVAPVYSAGESPIEGIDGAHLAEGLRRHGLHAVETVEGPENLADLIIPHAKAGDVIICLGAGTITRWAYDLPLQLEAAYALHAQKRG